MDTQTELTELQTLKALVENSYDQVRTEATMKDSFGLLYSKMGGELLKSSNRSENYLNNLKQTYESKQGAQCYEAFSKKKYSKSYRKARYEEFVSEFLSDINHEIFNCQVSLGEINITSTINHAL